MTRRSPESDAGADDAADDRANEVPDQPTGPTTMLPREKQFGYLAAAVGALFAIEVGVRNTSSLPAAGLGLVSAILLALAVRYGQRVITGFASLLAGFLLGAYLPLMALFLGYSGFLMLRVSKAQGQLRAAQPRPTPRQRREAKEARPRPGEDAKTGAARPTTRQPTANRRYTPPKPKPGQKR